MNINNKTLVSEIVANNYKTASIFKKYKVDFCCNGNRTIETVSKENNISSSIIINEINDLLNQTAPPTDYQNWNLDFLADYIYQNHHKYVERQVPEVIHYLDKIYKVHGDNHPELNEIRQLFKKSADELTMHMKKEELILFPFIKKIAKAAKDNSKLEKPPFETIQNPIDMMHTEHDDEGERFRKIEELSNNYNVPKDACNSYKIAFSLLKDFEQDLHKHIHLENNILFKKAIQTENQLYNN
ncbi:iron-sulfur cluster repair di-iron protein [Tenacibaculum sp. ZS6-P6]|uniref:iron-sulfur cluster repair di-iron protein n=1 Tax=Tenacibaculum sp. ZS6-P6 TaxID=3447503 RepID=UPI003F9453D4